MSLSFETFIPELHYEMLSNWWLGHNWPSPPVSHLPTYGIISNLNGKPSAAGFIYQTDSAFCLFEWIIVNPEVRRAERSEAISGLIEKAKEVARELGFQTIFMSVKSESLIGRLAKHGFQINDRSMADLTFHLQGGL